LPNAAIGLRPMNFSMPAGLPGAVIDEIDRGQPHQHRNPIFRTANSLWIELPMACSGGTR
jgi:hypothetical protein